jgi:argininosuccinate lyase
MKKLWEKGYELDPLAEQFTVGDDYIIDRKLVYYDCLGSIAHAVMLQSINILSLEELTALRGELGAIIDDFREHKFEITQQQEDVHTAVENRLTSKLGTIGKKNHSCRSRNDQSLVDLRLFMRDQILLIAEALLILSTLWFNKAQEYEFVPIPGRTHFQRVMVSSVGMLFGAYAESLLDNIELLKTSFVLLNQCPLGSGASYGVTLNINRQLTADLLGFDKVQNNVLYANNSRGKFESVLIHGLTQIMVDMSKMATDLILFSTPEFGYFTLPESMCSGSSLMPQKKNPCVLELLRAKTSTVQGHLFQTLSIITALPSGYNRDFQETKRPMMLSCDIVYSSLLMASKLINELKISRDVCLNSITSEIFATDVALRKTEEGVAFRDAYKDVANNVVMLANEDAVKNLIAKKHIGASGNLGIECKQQEIDVHRDWVEVKKNSIKNAFELLLKIKH